jgi:TetR/AcrR family transcriptional regulator, regulator of autoinduction and epiphytic fitness
VTPCVNREDPEGLTPCLERMRGRREASGTRPDATPADGRTLRGQHSRERILGATIDLITRGNPRPTSGQIAEAAGVSVGSLFYHYPQIEIVVEDALSQTFRQHLTKIVPLPPIGPVGTRVKTICRQRLLLFETLGPMLVAAHARAADSPSVAALLTELRTLLREQMTRTLEPEISSRASSGPLILEELLLASGWQSWEALRSDAGYPATTSEKIMIHNLLKLLE